MAGHMYWEEVAESTGTHTENTGLAGGASESRWGHRRPAQRDQNWVCGTVRQVSRTGTLATNDSIQARKMLYLPLGNFLDRPAKCRRRLRQGAKCTFSRNCRPKRTENPQLPLRC